MTVTFLRLRTFGPGIYLPAELIEEQNFDRSTGAATVTTDERGGQPLSDGSGNADGKREQSEKVEITGKDCNAHGLAVRAVKYLAGQGASSPASIIEPADVPSPAAAEQGGASEVSPVASPPEPDAQHEATVETTSPMPEASPSPASSQEPRSRGSGAVQDRCESTAPPIPEDEAPRAERLTGADETAPVSGDAGETNVASAPNAGALVAAIGANASSNNSDPVTDDFPELPSFLKRSAA